MLPVISEKMFDGGSREIKLRSVAKGYSGKKYLTAQACDWPVYSDNENLRLVHSSSTNDIGGGDSFGAL